MDEIEEVDPDTGQPIQPVRRKPAPPAQEPAAPQPPGAPPPANRYTLPPAEPTRPPGVAPSTAPPFAAPQAPPGLPQMQGPQPQYPGQYPYAYPYYYAPPYPYGYGQQMAPRKLEPRRLRTARALDSGVFALLLLGAAFAWSALVAAVAMAALMPSLSGAAALGATESSWLSGVMAVRVVVWLVFAVAAMAVGLAIFRFHEGRIEFGPEHERNFRDLQAASAVFLALVGGAGMVTFILSNPGEPRFPAPPNSLFALKSSVTLSALIWGAACAIGGLYLGFALTRMLRGFLPEEEHQKLSIVPVFCLFIPLLHTSLTAAFLSMVDPANVTWSSFAIHASSEVGGLAGALAAVPLIVLVRAFRQAHERIVAGEVKPVSLEPPV